MLPEKFNTFIDIYNDEFDGEDYNSLKAQLRAKEITVVLFSELGDHADFPQDSIIFVDYDPNDLYLFHSDLVSMTAEELGDAGFEFTNFSEYVNMYSEHSDGIAFIF
jgi:hypothetical protein